jgi:tetratricopeptide (TPR) repeat protein
MIRDSRPGVVILVLLGVVLAIATVAAYWQVLDHDFVRFDDYAYVTQNRQVTSGLTGENVIWAFTATEEANWHPLTWLSHMMDVELFGMNPRGHHFTNLLIHTCSTLLLLCLMVRLTGAIWRSLFVAGLFALHPLHVESVAWVAERKDVLSGFFWFATLWAYAVYVEKNSLRWYLCALAVFVLGLMAKPMVVTLPIVLLLLDYWPLRRLNVVEGRPLWPQLTATAPGLLREKIPFFAASLAATMLTVYAQQKGGTISSLEVVPLGLRIENTLVSYCRYLGKTIWPVDLSVFYPFPEGLPAWQVLGALLLLLGLSVGVLIFARKLPFLAVGWFWYVVTLLPVIGLVQIGGHAIADRYTYLPLTGVFIVFVWGVPELLKACPALRKLLVVAACACLGLLSVLTWQQSSYWRNSITLFQQAIRATPGNWMAHKALGSAFFEEGSLDEAVFQYRKSLELNPNYDEAFNSLGIALGTMGQFEASIDAFRQALSRNPRYAEAHNNLGVTLAHSGNFDAAVWEYREALAIDPLYFDAYRNLGFILADNGNIEGAIKAFQTALSIEPDNPVVREKYQFLLNQKSER